MPHADDVNGERRQARDLFNLYVGCAGNGANHPSDVVRGREHGVEVVAEHFDREITSHSCDQFVEAHLDWLGELAGIARGRYS